MPRSPRQAFCSRGSAQSKLHAFSSQGPWHTRGLMFPAQTITTTAGVACAGRASLVRFAGISCRSGPSWQARHFRAVCQILGLHARLSGDGIAHRKLMQNQPSRPCQEGSDAQKAACHRGPLAARGWGSEPARRLNLRGGHRGRMYGCHNSMREGWALPLVLSLSPCPLTGRPVENLGPVRRFEHPGIAGVPRQDEGRSGIH